MNKHCFHNLSYPESISPGERRGDGKERTAQFRLHGLNVCVQLLSLVFWVPFHLINEFQLFRQFSPPTSNSSLVLSHVCEQDVVSTVKLHILGIHLIGHFWVALCLCFKTSLHAKVFLMDISFIFMKSTCRTHIFIRMLSSEGSFAHWEKNVLGNNLLKKRWPRIKKAKNMNATET